MQRLLEGMRMASRDSMGLSGSLCFATYTWILRWGVGALATSFHMLLRRRIIRF